MLEQYPQLIADTFKARAGLLTISNSAHAVAQGDKLLDTPAREIPRPPAQSAAVKRHVVALTQSGTGTRWPCPAIFKFRFWP